MWEYKDYIDFLQKNKKYVTDICSSCGGKNEIVINKLNISIGNKNIILSEIPILNCVNCEEKHLPEYTKSIVRGLHDELVKKNQIAVESRYNNFKKKYNYAISANFEYDHRDYESIPGLCFDLENSELGFLTPVYFNIKALIYFMHDENYEVDLFSETYGNIRKFSDDPYWKYEWDIVFGINSNKRVVFWLGDLNEIDEQSQLILKPHNITSDHLGAVDKALIKKIKKSKSSYICSCFYAVKMV